VLESRALLENTFDLDSGEGRVFRLAPVGLLRRFACGEPCKGCTRCPRPNPTQTKVWNLFLMLSLASGWYRCWKAKMLVRRRSRRFDLLDLHFVRARRRHEAHSPRPITTSISGDPIRALSLAAFAPDATRPRWVPVPGLPEDRRS